MKNRKREICTSGSVAGSFPKVRQRKKEKCFLRLGPVHTPTPRAGGAGGKKSLSSPPQYNSNFQEWDP
jgi:hypothetical protein